MGAGFLLYRLNVQPPDEAALVAQVFVQPLRGEGQEGAEDDLQPVNGLQGDVDGRGRRLGICLDLMPGFFVVEITVGLPRQGHGLCQRGLELATGDQLTHAVEPRGHLGQQRLVCLVQCARLRHAAVEALVGEAQHAVGQVAPGGHQLVVVAAQELLPGEVDVLRLGGVDGQHVAQRVGIVAAEVVGQLDHPAATGGEFLALHVQEFVGRHVVGQVQPAVADEHPRPDPGVEGDVVLADEVVSGHVGVLPPLAPGLRMAGDRSPLLGG